MTKKKKPARKKIHQVKPDGCKTLSAVVPSDPPVIAPEQILVIDREQVAEILQSVPLDEVRDLRTASPEEPVVLAMLPRSIWQKISDWLSRSW